MRPCVHRPIERTQGFGRIRDGAFRERDDNGDLAQDYCAAAERGDGVGDVGLDGFAFGVGGDGPGFGKGLAGLHLGEEIVEEERGVGAEAAEGEYDVEFEAFGFEADVVGRRRVVVADPEEFGVGVGGGGEEVGAADAGAGCVGDGAVRVQVAEKMEDVIFLGEGGAQVGDRCEGGAGGCGIEALVDAEVGLEGFVKVRAELADEDFGGGDFFFAERVEKAHEFWRLNLRLKARIDADWFILFFVLRGLRALFQRFAVPDPALAAVAGQFEILGEFEGVDGAGIFAEAAEHAAAEIVGEVGELLAAGVLVARAGDDDEIFRAGHGAQVAGDAHGLVGIGIDVEARRSAITLGNLRTLQRILLGVDLFGVLIEKGDLQALKEIDEEDFAQQARHAHDGGSISGFKVSGFQSFKVSKTALFRKLFAGLRLSYRGRNLNAEGIGPAMTGGSK